MSNIDVYSFDYFNLEHGCRFPCRGMITKEKLSELKQEYPEKEYQIFTDSRVEIDESKLSETGRYHPPADDDE